MVSSLRSEYAAAVVVIQSVGAWASEHSVQRERGRASLQLRVSELSARRNANRCQHCSGECTVFASFPVQLTHEHLVVTETRYTSLSVWEILSLCCNKQLPDDRVDKPRVDVTHTIRFPKIRLVSIMFLRNSALVIVSSRMRINQFLSVFVLSWLEF